MGLFRGFANRRKLTMLDNLIDWKLELTLQERLTRRQAMAYFVDEAPLTLAVSLAPWIALLWMMH
jgi:hypothetical protein